MQDSTPSSPVSRRAIVLLLLLTAAVVGFWLTYMFFPLFTWRHFRVTRPLLHDQVLNDPALVGASKSDIRAKLGEPTQREGPYSWWCLIDPTSPEEERSALIFHYDDSLSVVDVTLCEVRAEKDRMVKPVQIHLENWKNESYEVKHRMNLDLVNRSQNDNLPSGLRNLDDVEKYFPRARYVDHWNYTTGMLQSVAMSFDRNNIVTEVWEGNE